MTDELVQAELRLRLAAAKEREQWFDLAVWQLFCGRPQDGLATLRARPAAADPRPELSVVAGDCDRAGAEARAALAEPAERLADGYRPYLRTLHSLIAGQPPETHLQELQGYVAAHERLRSGHPSAVVSIADGLVQRSAADVRDGLHALLAWHLRRARARSEIFNSARGVMSLEAIVALLLGHRLGLEVGVDDRYRRASVPLLAIHLVEHGGRPLPRGQELTLETDLVAGPWLREHGLQLAEPRPPAKPRARASRKPRRLPSAGSEEAARAALRERLRAGGSPWQLASWSLMLGDPEAGRAHLAAAAAAAQQRWETSRGGRFFRRTEVPVNQNAAREHFALALVIGDERSLKRTSEALYEWEATAPIDSPFAHASSYLDLIRHLVEPRGRRPTRAEAERTSGPLPSVRVACTGLVERDAELLGEGLRSLLREHAASLERLTSPPPPVCESAVHVAVAANRIGIDVDVDEDSRRYDVPVVLPDREVARLPCDLVAVAFWATGP